MSDKDKSKDEDIITSAEDAPETIGDENLEDIDGGGWTLRNVQVSSYSIGGAATASQPNTETVYGGVGNDDLLDVKGKIGRRRLPDPYGF